MSTVRKQFSKEFKAKVALEALKGLKTTAEISGEYGAHPTQIAQWKKELQEGVAGIFERGKSAREKENEKLVDRLYRQIGQLQMDCDWLKKKLPL
jgi:putative transposase